MMWFGLYSRSDGRLDSSGFEHIFVGQYACDHVIGCQNAFCMSLSDM